MHTQSVGILALQGCIDPHIEHLNKLGSSVVAVRSKSQLDKIDRLIIPGGESTTMLKLLRSSYYTDQSLSLFEAIKEFTKTMPVWGICAGAILLASEVKNPEQESLKAINIRAIRNHYGSQLDSFKANLKLSIFENNETIAVDFIRAPKLEPLDSSIEFLGRTAENEPVLLKCGKILCSAFHTELGTDSRLHQYFLTL